MKLETEIELLQVKDGDTVLLRYNPEIHPDPEHIAGDKLRKYFEQIGTKVTVLVAPFGMDIETLDEDAMKLYGWVRPPRRPERKRKEKPKAPQDAPGVKPGPTTPGLA